MAVVTGASKGIGADIAVGMAAAGASVVVNYLSDRAGADEVAARIAQAGGRSHVFQGDMSKEHEARSVVGAAVTAFGRIDVLVNNAAHYHYSTLDLVTSADFHRHFDLKVLGPLIAIQEASRLMGADGGSIVNIGSAASRALLPSTTLYSASKSALGAMTTTLAKELAPRGIRVNVIHPGPVDTEGVRAAGLLGGEWEDQLVAMTPLGRLGQVSDITPVALFLASDDSRWITGEAHYPSGGL